MKMFSKKSLVSTLALGGLMIAGTSASAAVVDTFDTMIPDDPFVSGNLEWFEFGGPNVSAGLATDNNQYATFNKNSSQFAGQGISHHSSKADLEAALGSPLADGNAIKMSAWVLSDSTLPWATQDVEGFKIEFYDNSVLYGEGALNGAGFVNDTEVGFGLGLTKETTAISGNDTWTYVEEVFQINDALLGFATLDEVRPVFFTGDWTGTDTDGRLKIDNWTMEVFADVATANAAPAPTSAPGGFDVVDLSGDINGDGFVGLDDLDIVLNTWNNGIPPAPSAPSIPEPASLALQGLGSLAALRRR